MLCIISVLSLTAQFDLHFIQYSGTGTGNKQDFDIMDYNGDGFPDALLGFESRRDLLIHKNLGNTFYPEIVRDSATGYDFVFCNDFNSDGFEDFFLFEDSLGQERIYLYLNDGNFNYNKFYVGPGHEVVANMIVEDLDNDMDKDIVFDLNDYSGRLYVYENNGDSTFTSHIGSLDLPGQPNSLHAIKDMNNDGKMDIVATYFDFGPDEPVLTIAENDGAFGFTLHRIDTLDLWPQVTVGEFSAGGLPDIVVSDHTAAENEGVVLRNDSAWSFVPVFNFTVPANGIYSMNLTIDYNTDGKDDFFVSHYDGTDVYLNNGNSTFTVQNVLGDNTGAVFSWEDLNQDGLKDFVSVGGALSFYLQQNNGSGNYDFAYDVINFDSKYLLFPDLNGNGSPDVVGVNYTYMDFIIQDFDHTLGPIQSYMVGEGNWTPLTDTREWISYDYDGNGDDELIFSKYDSLFLLDYVNGTFEQSFIYKFPNQIYSLKITDLDQDGNIEFTHYGGGLKSYERIGNSFTETVFGVGTTYFLDDDIDGDNDDDLIYMMWGNPVELRYLQNNNGVFTDNLLINISAFVDGTTASNLNDTEFRLYDIDGDGDQDIFILSQVEDKFVWLRKDGNFTYTPFSIPLVLDDPRDLDFGDFDQDLDEDIVLTNSNDYETLILYNDGNEVFTDSVVYKDQAGPIKVTSIDFDQDGDLDVFSQSFRDRKVYLMENLETDCPRSYSHNTSTICTGDSILFAGLMIHNAGFHFDSAMNVLGCDSIISLELTYYPVSTILISGDNEICAGDSINLTANGANSYIWDHNDNGSVIQVKPETTTTYIANGTDSFNCTYPGSYQVKVNPLPTPVINDNGFLLTTQSFQSYQWYLEEQLYPDATNSSLNYWNNGSYTVEVTDSKGCTNFSEPYVVGLSVATSEENHMISVYPNPTSNALFIKNDQELSEPMHIQIHNALGLKVAQHFTSQKTYRMDMNAYVHGLYFLEVDQGSQHYSFKVLKQ